MRREIKEDEVRKGGGGWEWKVGMGKRKNGD